MKFYIKEARERAGLSQKELARIIGVAPSTFHGYESGGHDPKSELLVKIASACHVSTDFLLGNPSPADADPSGGGQAPLLSDGAVRLARDYDALDRWGRQAVRELTDTELARCKDEARFLAESAPEPEPKVIPLYRSPYAAGIASPVFGRDYEEYELTDSDPQGATFAVKVQGDSMEPYFPDGSVVFCNRDPLRDGDVGVFYITGDGGVIKQYHYDGVLGMTYLFSLNRNRADADVLITSTGGREMICQGRVITKRRFPIPGL